MQPKINTKKKKLLFFLPLFVVGLAGLILAGINIVDGTHGAAGLRPNTPNALNTHLPPPNLPVKQKNKFEVYMQAARDSAKREEEWQRDPSNKDGYNATPPISAKANRPISTLPRQQPTGSGNDPKAIDPNEAKVNERLEKLHAALNSAKLSESAVPGNFSNRDPQAREISPSAESSRLEHLLELSHAADTASDPNIERYEKMLDKVLQIQHPERTETGKVAANIEKAAVYDVSLSQEQHSPNTLSQDQTENSQNGFYGLDDSPDTATPAINSTIQAVVPETQTLQTGSTIKLRLLQDIYTDNRRIPANSFVYGICSVNSERLQVQLNNVLSGDEIIPIALKVYDTDGLEGVSVPGAVTRDLTKEGVAQGIGSMGLTSFDPSLGAQAAAAGIQTAQTLISKKVRAVIVTIKEGHRLLLKNAHPPRSRTN